MKTNLLLLFLLAHFSLSAQRTIEPTDTIKITGQIKVPRNFSLADLDAFSTNVISTQIIYNHKGEAKDTLTDMKGISLKKLLETTEYLYEKPKELNEFYFVFTATDGYKVVFSWNEIYNTEAGNEFYIIIEKNGKKLRELDQRILFISTGDLKSGRRYIKGLETIEVKRVE